MKKFSIILIQFLLVAGLFAASPMQEKKVDLNQATETEFESLPGIGPALAKRIVEHRKENGPFKKLADLLNVKGIGAKKFEGLEKYLSLGKVEEAGPSARKPSGE